MALVPVRMGEKLRIVEMARADPRQAEIDERLAEDFRIAGIVKRRRYVDGEQYDKENFEALLAERCDPFTDRLPEHLRKHAYSTQIGECVRFIADQLAESFEIVAEDDLVDATIETALALSSQLSGEGDDDDVSIEDVLEDALIAGDVAVELRWDPVEKSVFYDLWESEQVEIEWLDRDTISKVSLRELRWVEAPDLREERQVTERTEWTLEEREAEGTVWFECERRVYWDDEEEPRSSEWTGFPLIPWRLLRCRKRGLRGQRGESIITVQAMEASDRLNANEQVGWLIARANSHSNLVVVGDAAFLKSNAETHMIGKDVLDVLTFPGGTAVTSVSLPTDPEMIEHQRKVLTESIYNIFGLTRVEPDTIQGLGTVSGYALEILNRKSEGTFRKVQRHFRRDLRTLFNVTLELHDALVLMPDDDFDDEISDEPTVPAWVHSDGTLFPNRRMEIRMGTGFVVDEVLIRDDYTSGLISRREALRQRGKSDDEIDLIEQEIGEQAETTGGESGRFSTQAGRTLGQ